MVQSQKQNNFPQNNYYFQAYRRMNRATEKILTSFDVFFDYAYCFQISNFHSYFYCGKT